MALLKNLTLMN